VSIVSAWPNKAFKRTGYARRLILALGVMKSGSHIKYRLGLGSPLLRSATWAVMGRNELKALIQRFATRESGAYGKGAPGSLWRRRRLAAVTLFEARFGSAPALFTKHKLPRFRSFYVHQGQYLWPSAAQQVIQADAASPRRLT